MAAAAGAAIASTGSCHAYHAGHAHPGRHGPPPAGRLPAKGAEQRRVRQPRGAAGPARPRPQGRILSRRPSSTLFTVLALGASIGLLVPALAVGGLFIGLREAQVAEQTLQRDLDAKLDVLASSLPELLWNLDTVAAREVVSAIVKSPEVVRVSVSDASQGLPFIDERRPRSEERRVGKECRSRWSPY